MEQKCKMEQKWEYGMKQTWACKVEQIRKYKIENRSEIQNGTDMGYIMEKRKWNNKK